jgi:Domain of unknown function (DUF4160)
LAYPKLNVSFKRGLISIRLYADDHHPPHFYIVSPTFEVVIRISDLSVIAGKARKSEIAEAIEWARMNKEIITLKWAELNERD